MDLTKANGVVSEQKEECQSHPASVAMVDLFLVEALQNPRHRLTILRMELDIQKFLQNPDQNQFEFPHFPTSYLRLAAHRVAQHYGLPTMVLDNAVEGQGNKILVIKKQESKFPPVCLSDVPAKDLESDKPDRVKIVIRPRPKASCNSSNESALKNQSRNIEERKEEYDKARARIFSSIGGLENASVIEASSDAKKMSVVDDEPSKHLGEKNLVNKETCNSTRVAILRNIEKDRTDPDYDRTYDRYAKSAQSNQSFNMAPFSIQKMPLPPFVYYDPSFPQPVQTPPLNYRIPLLSPFSVTGFDQNSGEALSYMQWPTQSMVYPQAYDQPRHGFFQVPSYQQPLSFDYSQNYHRQHLASSTL